MLRHLWLVHKDDVTITDNCFYVSCYTLVYSVEQKLHTQAELGVAKKLGFPIVVPALCHNAT